MRPGIVSEGVSVTGKNRPTQKTRAENHSTAFSPSCAFLSPRTCELVNESLTGFQFPTFPLFRLGAKIGLELKPDLSL